MNNKQSLIELLANRIYGNQPLEDYLNIPKNMKSLNTFITNLSSNDAQYLSPIYYKYWNDVMQGGDLKAGTKPLEYPKAPEELLKIYNKSGYGMYE